MPLDPKLVAIAADLTGCSFPELMALEVGDFKSGPHPHLVLRQRGDGVAKVVPLNASAAGFFELLAKGHVLLGDGHLSPTPRKVPGPNERMFRYELRERVLPDCYFEPLLLNALASSLDRPRKVVFAAIIDRIWEKRAYRRLDRFAYLCWWCSLQEPWKLSLFLNLPIPDDFPVRLLATARAMVEWCWTPGKDVAEYCARIVMEATPEIYMHFCRCYNRLIKLDNLALSGLYSALVGEAVRALFLVRQRKFLRGNLPPPSDGDDDNQCGREHHHPALLCLALLPSKLHSFRSQARHGLHTHYSRVYRIVLSALLRSGEFVMIIERHLLSDIVFAVEKHIGPIAWLEPVFCGCKTIVVPRRRAV